MVNHECKTTTYVLIDENCTSNNTRVHNIFSTKTFVYLLDLTEWVFLFFIYLFSISFFFWGGGTGDIAGLRNDVFFACCILTRLRTKLKCRCNLVTNAGRRCGGQSGFLVCQSCILLLLIQAFVKSYSRLSLEILPSSCLNHVLLRN